MPIDQVLAKLGTSSAGLPQAEAEQRLAEHGPNELESARGASAWSILVNQFRNVLIVILLIATALSLFLGEEVEAIAIAVIVLFAIVLGYVQEYRAERAIEALRRMAALSANVVRDGEEAEIPARELVPGDVVYLKAGDRVPADVRLIEAVNLQVNEAALTGESVSVEKDAAPLADEELGLGDRRSMAYAGTAATYGRGRSVVVATGMETEFGRIARMLQTVEIGKTPLQENLDRVGTALAKGALAIVAAIVALGLYRGQPFLEMLFFGIALAVAVVPEALPAVVTISLAIGVKRMVKRHALMRRLVAVETLGNTSFICADKTGTLTKDEMTARQIFVAGEVLEVSGAGYEPRGGFTRGSVAFEPNAPLRELLSAAALASDAHVVQRESDDRWHVRGDPTEGAMVVAAAKAGLAKAGLDESFPRVNEIPFTSERKRMTTLHETGEGHVAHSKGAAEIILASCSRQRDTGGVSDLDSSGREAIQEAALQMASEGLRVLAVASKANARLDDAENEMTFLGLVGMSDPPRPEARAAIETCERAGIKPVVITGDHPLTATAVARELGLLGKGRIITGAELEAMTDEEFERSVEDIVVYARVSPEDKLRVVTTLQKKGHVVAMTGDGVNDAPALKKADIGIAMGITGTDVAKEAAAMMLTDDNFASIVAAVEEGRAIFGNIKKYLMYLLSSNIGEAGLMAGASLAGMPLPLTAVQILYVNLATDGLPALALAVDPPEVDLMSRNPRKARDGIFTRPIVTLMVIGGLWSTLANLGLFTWVLGSGRSLREAMTMTFVSLVLIQFFKAYNFRSERHSIVERPFANKWLNLAILWEITLLALIIYLPFLQHALGTFSLSFKDWAIVVLTSATITPVLEAGKWMVRRGWFAKTV
ncbi:MAG: cation-translocating P-type ATPase [Deltaproteobacteria bacterium]|nr:cation-translocating P-type ATPase [Deltaproteobacteria bacterium]